MLFNRFIRPYKAAFYAELLRSNLMDINIIKTEYKIYHVETELSAGDQQLINLAKEHMNHSYSPYSKFKVGVGLLLENGETLGGSNQENASYPICICGEQVALSSASSRYPGVPIKKIAICAGLHGNITKDPIMPCGSCRQAICEYESRYKQDIEIILYSSAEIYTFKCGKDLLPFYFSGDNLF